MDEKDGHTVSTEGVTVWKHVDTERFKTPAVVLDVASTADRSVTATVTEPIPESFAIEDIGFHPDFGGEHWSASGRELTFERTLDPGEEYTTVYGVRGVDEEAITAFLESRPTVAADTEGNDAAPPDAEGNDAASPSTEGDGGSSDAADAEALLTDDDGAVRDVIAGERDSLRAAAGESPDVTAELPESDDPVADAGSGATDVAEGVDTGTAEGSATGADSDDAGVTDDGGRGGRTMPGSVAGALAAEFEDGSVSAADERALREALSEPVPGSVDTRIDHLQARVSDVEAYADELERFLDEHGGGDSALADVEADLAAVIDRVDALEADLAELRETAESLQETVDALGTAVGGIEERLDGVETEMGERVEDVETSMEERIDDVETTARDRIEEVETATDERFEEVEADVDDLGSEIAEMKEFRDQLSSALGPAPGGGQSSEEQGEE